MFFFAWFDDQTLSACEILLATPFLVVFVALQRAYPNLRGIYAVGISFLLGIAGSALIESHGPFSHGFKGIIGDTLFLASFLVLYRGILRFIGSRRNSRIPWIVSAIALFALVYYHGTRSNAVLNVVAVAFATGIVRGFIAVELVRKSPTFVSPSAMLGFAGVIGTFAAIGIYRGVLTLLDGVPIDVHQAELLQTWNLVFNLASICITALFFLALAGLEIIRRKKEAFNLDELSGAFNRRGMEARLTQELKTLAAGNGKLTIALVAIDRLRSINESHGRAAGDDALRAVAHAIAKCSRSHDIVGRFGGDDFLVVFPQTPCGEALLFTERLTVAVAALPRAPECAPLTLSVGLTQAISSDEADTLIARASRALFQARNNGGNCRRVVIEGETFPGHQSAVLTAAADRVPMTAFESHLLQ
jgi:diguanylate cyclase (GGDEF)-like protein